MDLAGALLICSPSPRSVAERPGDDAISGGLATVAGRRGIAPTVIESADRLASGQDARVAGLGRCP